MKPLPQFKDGEWIAPIHRGFVMGCCDCGLRHRMDFKIKDGAVMFRSWRLKKRKRHP